MKREELKRRSEWVEVQVAQFAIFAASAVGDLRTKESPLHWAPRSELVMLDGDPIQESIQKGVQLGFSVFIVLTVYSSLTSHELHMCFS